jgi:hypothetical protein
VARRPRKAPEALDAGLGQCPGMTPDVRPGTTATDGIGARPVRQRAKL